PDPERPLIEGCDKETTSIILVTHPEVCSHITGGAAASLVIVVHGKVLTLDFNNGWILNRHTIPVGLMRKCCADGLLKSHGSTGEYGLGQGARERRKCI